MHTHEVHELICNQLRADLRDTHARHLRYAPTISRDQVADIVIRQQRDRFERLADDAAREGRDAVADVLEGYADAVPELIARVLRTL